jgi:hypothetical protein
MKTMIDGVVRDATPEEIAKHEALKLAAAQFLEPPAPTKEELLAQLNAIAAQIQAL